MSFRSVWRKAGAIVLGASLVGALVAVPSVSAQAPVIPTLAIVTAVKDAGGAAISSGTVSAWIGTTKCVEKPIGANLALDIGQPNQPAACVSGAGAAGTDVSFQINGLPATATPAIKTNPGVPQNVVLQVAAQVPTVAPTVAPTAAPGVVTPRPGATGTGGGLDSGMMALGLGVIALAAVGGGVAVRRVRR